MSWLERVRMKWSLAPKIKKHDGTMEFSEVQDPKSWSIMPLSADATREVVQMAFNMGYAMGERSGAQAAFTAIEQVVAGRGGLEMTSEDVDVVRKRSLH